MVDFALKTLVHDKVRFAIAVIGVGFAVALVLLQTGLFLGLLDNASVTIANADADIWVTAKNAENVDFATIFPEGRVQRVRSTPGIVRADNLIVWFGSVSLPTGAQEQTLLYALNDFSTWRIPWAIDTGDVEDLRRGPYVFFDGSAEKRLGEFAVGDYREIFGKRLRIVGRTEGALSFTTSPITFIDFRLMQSLVPESLKGQTTYILVKLEPGADTAGVMAELRARLPNNDVYTKSAWAARSRAYWVESTGIGLNFVLTVFLGALVAVVIVAQTLYSSTMEHLREFGVVKAFGGSDALVYRIIAKQATIAALAGFALGAIPLLFADRMVESLGLRLLVPQPFYIVVLLATLALCLGAGAISFRRVARLDPILVFRT
ncbi:MAG: ABC transporter permease [Gemmatimonadota bacterium]|nr:ABC transporter permease [Gemmatimonadota bacterium]